MPNIWHLTHQTLKTNHHQISQISKFLTHGYSTVSYLRRYGQMCQNFYYYFIYFFSLLPRHISLSAWFSLSVWFSFSTLISVVSLFPQSFSNANANSRSPLKTKHKNSLKITQKQNRRSIFFVDFPNSPSLFGTPSQPSISLTLTQTLISV